MIFRSLGKTGLKLSILGFGASPLGNEFGKIDPVEGKKAVNLAIDFGINYFDVSPYYGRTLAEARLGDFLRGHREKVILATKVGRYGKDLETGFDFSRERIFQSIEESLSRLKTDYIDVYQLHDIEFAEKKLIVEVAIPALQELKQSGKVRFIGITGYPLQLLRDIATNSEIDTVLSYCHYDLLDTTLNRDILPAIEKKNLGLINAAPLHMGLLSNRMPPEWHPAPKRVVDITREAKLKCRSLGVDISSLALQFALAHESVATTLIGMGSPEEVQLNTRAVGIAPDPYILREVLNVLKPAKNIAWQEGRTENFVPNAVPKQT